MAFLLRPHKFTEIIGHNPKLIEVQEVLLSEKDFLKRAVESFCQKLKHVEITQFL